ncbi:membrane selenoprotein [Heterostelium album PN500]|uniref:Membrane selenoprotein n=1 Tax=Heterostelium pallidum (strain ATCC 26659 / Pp 5 / PN500) TaxID=670386 RepID=D3B6P8_HETP5|nr:membrane selenoprotein [Heterostelium album PN500]EFA83018.1 membrane selenoprotein [Heterostelium album PN500]|eukprot:XP_020435135.1 membrane selenoprotein [Heterostelium album PN500]
MSFFADIPKYEEDCEGGDDCCSTANNNLSDEADEKVREESDKDKKPLYIAILSVLISIPALGFAHAITFAISLTILSNLSQYHYHKCCTRRSDKGHWYKFGPFYLTAVAVPFATVDILRHILVDNGLWTTKSRWSPAAYRPGCNSESMKCLSATGWFFVVFCTYFGYILLMVGTIWCADLHLKIKKLWKQLRPSK